MKSIKIKRILSYLCMAIMLCEIFPSFSLVSAETIDNVYFNHNYIRIMKDEQFNLKIVGDSSENITVGTDDETIAIISQDGTVCGIGEGKTEVYATNGNTKAVCTVVVKEPIESGIRLSNSYLIGKQNDTFLLTVESAENVDVSEITWSSSNKNVATVDNNGLVKIVLANNRNKAIITATAASGETASCNVYVHNNKYEAISTNTHFFGNKNDSDDLLQYMYSTDSGKSFTHYSQCIGDAWLDTGARTGRIQNWRMQGKPGYWATIAFKAPYTGTLGIYYNGGCTTDGDVKFKIIHNSEKIYPYEEDKEYITVSASSTDTDYVTLVNGIICLKDLTLDDPSQYTENWADGVKVDVTEGDYIYLLATSEGANMIAYTRGFEFMYDDYESNKIDLCSVNISLDSGELECGEKAFLKTSYSGDNVIYYSEDESVATVDENGMISAVAEGTTKIYAIVDETVADYCDITVSPRRKILMNKKYLQIGVGEARNIKAAYYPVSGLEKMEWSSSNPDVATIDENGNVTAVSEGIAVITASNGDKKAECIVEAAHIFDEIALNYSNIWVGKGKTFPIKVITNEEVADKKIIWTTGNSNIANVDKNGIVSGTGVGVTKVRAAFENNPDIYAECVVAVGTMDQFSLFSGTDNSDMALWQYAYMPEDKTEYTKFTKGTGARWINNVTFIQAADISFVEGSETVRMFRAPVTGKIKITVKDGNAITNSATSNPAKAEFCLNFRGENIKKFMFESQTKSDSEYYTSTSFDGAKIPGATSETAYASDINFKDELGIVTLDVCRGEYIYFVYRGITGRGHVSHYNGGICVEYTSIEKNTELSAGIDELTMTKDSIYELDIPENGILFYTDDESIAKTSESGSIKAVSVGETVVYISNGDNSLMDYIEITVINNGLQADAPEYNSSSGKITVAVKNLGSSVEKVKTVAITRDRYGRPIAVYESEEKNMASSSETEIEIDGVRTENAKKIEIFVWKCGSGLVPVRPSKIIEVTD